MSSLSTRTSKFIRTLNTPRGWNAGEPFRILPWQAKFIKGLLEGDKRIHILSVPRGAGKSTLLGAVGAAMVGGPLVTPNVENLIIAPRMRQAQSIFNSARAMLKIPLSGDKSRRFGLTNSGPDREIKCLKTGCVLRICSSDAKTIMGEGQQYALLDELAFYPQPEDTYHAVETSMGKIPNSKLILIGTRPAIGEGSGNIFNRLIASGREDVAVTLYSYEGDKPLTMEAAYKANPSLKYFPALRGEIKAELKNAKKDAGAEVAFRSTRLNDGTGYSVDNMDTALIKLDDWIQHVERGMDSLPASEGGFYLGLDPGGSSAWTACALYFPESTRLIVRCWLPEYPSLKARSREDHIEIALYHKLIDSGELIVHPGYTVELDTVLTWVKNNYGMAQAVLSDRYRIDRVNKALKDAKYNVPFILRGIGPKDGDQDTRLFQDAVLSGKVTSHVSTLMRFGIGEARLKLATTGAQQLDKSRRRAKNDMYAASILAVAYGVNNPVRKGRRLRMYVGGAERVRERVLRQSGMAQEAAG